MLRRFVGGAPSRCAVLRRHHHHHHHHHVRLCSSSTASPAPPSSSSSSPSSSSTSSSSSSSVDVLAFADGASRGNPGKGGCGALLVDAATARVLASRALYLGERETNNTAEYRGLLLALELAQSHAAARVHVHMDSELIVRQMNGVYRVKAPHLRALYHECRALCDAFERVTFSHVRREANAAADRLANEAIDAHDQLQEQERSGATTTAAEPKQ